MADELPLLTVADAAAWRAWLDGHHRDPAGVCVVLAKKGTTAPTSLSYDQALEEALCHGWIDGQVRRGDEATYLQRFTPRRVPSKSGAGSGRQQLRPLHHLCAEGLGQDHRPTDRLG